MRAQVLALLLVASAAGASTSLFTPVVGVSSNQSVNCDLLSVDSKDIVGAEVTALAGATQLADSACPTLQTGDTCGVSVYPSGLGVGAVRCQFSSPSKKVRADLSIHSTADGGLQVVVPASK